MASSIEGVMMLLELIFEICMSTQFGRIGDGYGGRTPTIYYQRPVSKTDMGIAHRDLPIGSLIRITNLRTGLSAKVRVIDRGPYGKLDKRGRWFNGARDKKREGTYRACADLTERLARTIKHNGKEPVLLQLIKEDHEPRRYFKRRPRKRRKQRVPLKQRRNT